MQTADILLVDDSKAAVVLMMEALKEAKVDNSLHVLEDGENVLKFLAEDSKINSDQVRPDLIMLDLNMPNRTGLDVLKEIKNHKDFKIIPVIVMTSSEEETDIARAYEYQANSYITKPVNFERLTEVVEIIEKYWLTTAKLPPKNTKL